MTAPESVVRAVEETLPCNIIDGRCYEHESSTMSAERGCSKAVDIADAAVSAYLASPEHAALLRAERAKALREVAHNNWLGLRTEGPGRVGTAGWPEDRRDIYSIAIEEAMGVLAEHADRIEGGDDE